MTPLVSFVSAIFLTLWLAGRFSPFRIDDAPNERSLHDQPVPRTGGIAIVFAVAAGWWALFRDATMPPWYMALAGGALLVAVLSLLDDLIELSPALRLPVHLVASTLIVAAGDVSPWVAIAGALALSWMLNLYNFMDGMDGFAGGMSVIGFSALGLAGWLAGDGVFMSLSLCVAAASAGFLMFNFPPARIFMGDVGSATLGLLAGGLSWHGWLAGLFPLWFPILVFSPFVVDATVTLARRAIRGEKVWQAHREHCYQKLVLAGWGHRRTVLAEYALMLMAALAALFLLDQGSLVPVGLLIWAMVYLFLICWVELRTR
ncbi:MAG: glycosyltransferase family 4 protein [Deltaproteobacteria bacterium]|nr:MAG: glycosyltransferase family 4 protein [Deltaproteobacteria bacterium]